MNKQLLRLSEIAQKPQRTIVGLMSGTSLDGLDITLCKFKWKKLTLLEFKTVDYPDELRKRIRAIQSQSSVSLQEVCVLNTELAHLYAQFVLEALNEWGVESDQVDLIASHGQTIYHSPNRKMNSTLQIVDGDHIAEKTGIITISDFRQKHVAQGGEGAPLAEIIDELWFRSEEKNRLLLNLGGIANFTWLPSTESKEEVVSSDIGPANTLINEAMMKYFDKPFDENGKVASIGKVHSELLKYLLLEPFFRKPFPKTTGQEDFNLTLVEELMEGYQIELEPKDLIATLTQLTIQSITRAIDEVVGDVEFELFVSGGGLHNATIMDGLKSRLEKAELKDLNEFGFSPDAKEAMLMAHLANECVVGGEWELGKISLPSSI
ncbi:MAG: anhydro-N-acetylmuramic acid kinase [Balneola sp.]